jgi:hypothetical protein
MVSGRVIAVKVSKLQDSLMLVDRMTAMKRITLWTKLWTSGAVRPLVYQQISLTAVPPCGVSVALAVTGCAAPTQPSI